MDGSSIELNVKGYTAASHVSHIALSGAGLKDGFYAINVNGEKVSQVYVKNNERPTRPSPCPPVRPMS